VGGTEIGSRSRPAKNKEDELKNMVKRKAKGNTGKEHVGENAVKHSIEFSQDRMEEIKDPE
jgi:hypothetical protein